MLHKDFDKVSPKTLIEALETFKSAIERGQVVWGESIMLVPPMIKEMIQSLEKIDSSHVPSSKSAKDALGPLCSFLRDKQYLALTETAVSVLVGVLGSVTRYTQASDIYQALGVAHNAEVCIQAFRVQA